MEGASPFSYSDLVLIGNDDRAYYADYAVGNASSTTSVAANQLRPGGACDVHVAFSVPNGVAPVKVVYGATNPAIVVNLI